MRKGLSAPTNLVAAPADCRFTTWQAWGGHPVPISSGCNKIFEAIHKLYVWIQLAACNKRHSRTPGPFRAQGETWESRMGPFPVSAVTGLFHHRLRWHLWQASPTQQRVGDFLRWDNPAERSS